MYYKITILKAHRLESNLFELIKLLFKKLFVWLKNGLRWYNSFSKYFPNRYWISVNTFKKYGLNQKLILNVWYLSLK